MENIANICNVNLLPFKKNKLLDARVPRKIDEEYSLSIINSQNLSFDRLEMLTNMQSRYFAEI